MIENCLVCAFVVQIHEDFHKISYHFNLYNAMFVACLVSDVYGKLKTLSLVKENHLQEVEEEQPQEEIEEDPATEMSV